MWNQPFLAKVKENWLNLFENNRKYFSKFFLKKKKKKKESQIFGEIFVFLGESFLPPKRKKNINQKKKSLTDRPYLEGPSAHKQSFFFSWPCGILRESRFWGLATLGTWYAESDIDRFGSIAHWMSFATKHTYKSCWQKSDILKCFHAFV